MNPWPHQCFAVDEVEMAIKAGHKRILLSIPTGGGKTFVAAELIKIWREQGHRVGLYSNRRAMVDQLSRMLDEYGISHGIRASGHSPDWSADVQISSVQTEQRRTKEAVGTMGAYVLHDCTRVIVDEAHINASEGMLALLKRHVEAGAVYVGLTATPIDLAHAYDVLIQAGRTSELRKCGALVEAIHFGPDEPDLRAFKKLKKNLANVGSDSAEITESQARDLIMTPSIFGRVWEWFERLNPTHEPSILFAPGVKESLWFAHQFSAAGVPSAHLDGEHIWTHGMALDQVARNTKTLRQEVLDGSKEGRFAVLCNRFVLREGIDAPWLSYGIFATVFGSLQTFLQSGGRLLRSHLGVPVVRIQDHGGNWWRWGSLNADREWVLDHTGTMLQGMRADAIREGREKPPFRCPECATICIMGRCRNCGWYPDKAKIPRPVIGTEGELRLMHGDIYRPRVVYKKPDGPKKWKQMFWRSRTEKGQRTFRAAMTLYAQENYWQWPDLTWPLMPKDRRDLWRLVKDVPFESLIKESDSGQEEDHGNAESEASLFAGHRAGDDSRG